MSLTIVRELDVHFLLALSQSFIHQVYVSHLQWRVCGKLELLGRNPLFIKSMSLTIVAYSDGMIASASQSFIHQVYVSHEGLIDGTTPRSPGSQSFIHQVYVSHVST